MCDGNECAEDSKVPSGGRILDKFFSGATKVFLKDLNRVFLDIKSQQGTHRQWNKKKHKTTTEMTLSDSEAVKLGLVYSVENFLLGKDKIVLVKMDQVLLVDDMDRFGSYQWGKLSFPETVNSL